MVLMTPPPASRALPLRGIRDGEECANPCDWDCSAGRRTMAERDARIDRLLLGQEIADFLYREAELLDERRFTRADSDINWFDEGKDTLSRRVRQIETGMHWAEEPRSRLSHLVANV